MSHTHTMKDTDPSFFIDADLRTIESTSEDPVTLVKGDHNSEIFTFEMDRYIDEHDLKQCNKVEVHYINIDANASKNKSHGIYTVTDLAVDPSDSNSISFTWKVPITATTYAGALRFVVRFECTEGEEILYSWNTTPCNEVSVLDSIYNTDFIEEEYTDVIGEWYNEILSAKNQAIDEIGKSGGIVVSRTEPESDDVNVWVDNSEEEVVMLLEASDCVKMANSIKGNASGEVIRLDDVSPLEHGVKAKVRGKNLLKSIEGFEMFGITMTVRDDGGYTFNGTATGGHFSFTIDLDLEAGSYAIAAHNAVALGSSASNAPYMALRSATKEWLINRTFTTTDAQVIFTVSEPIKSFLFAIPQGVTVNDYTIYLQLEEGTSVTEYTPYVDPTTVTVTGCGKNLIPYPYYDSKTSYNGLTVSETNGKLVLNGTASADGAYTLFNKGSIPVKGKFTLSGLSGGSSDTIYIQPYIDNVAQRTMLNGSYTYEWDGMLTKISIFFKAGATFNNLSITPQLEFGDNVTGYECYIRETYTPSSDGSVVIDSVSPNMTVFTDTAGVTIELEYNKDINKVLANLPSGGGGGESVDIVVDNTVTQYSDNPVSSDAVYNEFARFSNVYDPIIDEHKTEAVNEANTYTNEKVGDIETALDSIIVIQNSLIGGDA